MVSVQSYYKLLFSFVFLIALGIFREQAFLSQSITAPIEGRNVFLFMYSVAALIVWAGMYQLLSDQFPYVMGLAILCIVLAETVAYLDQVDLKNPYQGIGFFLLVVIGWMLFAMALLVQYRRTSFFIPAVLLMASDIILLGETHGLFHLPESKIGIYGLQLVGWVWLAYLFHQVVYMQN
jgi:hypothetical protein